MKKFSLILVACAFIGATTTDAFALSSVSQAVTNSEGVVTYTFSTNVVFAHQATTRKPVDFGLWVKLEVKDLVLYTIPWLVVEHWWRFVLAAIIIILPIRYWWRIIPLKSG